MKLKQNPSLENLQFSVQHVLSLVSIFLKGGRKTQRGIELIYLLVFQFLMDFRWLYTRSIVIDGNFSAEHLKMKQPEEDVALSPGGRCMVEPERYELHLSTGVEGRQVSVFEEICCYNF